MFVKRSRRCNYRFPKLPAKTKCKSLKLKNDGWRGLQVLAAQPTARMPLCVVH
jgi:hypothetical protein